MLKRLWASYAEMAAILGWLQLPAQIPNNNVGKDEFKRNVATALNVDQWKRKCQVILGQTPAQTALYGGRDQALEPLWTACPFC